MLQVVSSHDQSKFSNLPEDLCLFKLVNGQCSFVEDDGKEKNGIKKETDV